jgi:hypothetical protein
VEDVQLELRVTTTVENALDRARCVMKKVNAFRAIYMGTELTAKRLSTTTFQILEPHGLELRLQQQVLVGPLKFLRTTWLLLLTSKTATSLHHFSFTD